jgi:hypothetical protein
VAGVAKSVNPSSATRRRPTHIADYLSDRPIGRIVGLEPIGDDDYVLAIEDVRDERLHVVVRRRIGWLKAVEQGRYVLPALGLCERCETSATATWTSRSSGCASRARPTRRAGGRATDSALGRSLTGCAVGGW